VAVEPTRYPVHRPKEQTPEAPPAADDRFYQQPWMFGRQAARLPPQGARVAGGTVVQGAGFQLLVPDGFEQLERSSDREMAFVRGRLRDLMVLRLRVRPGSGESPAEMARSFVSANEVEADGSFEGVRVMGTQGVRWTGQHLFHETLQARVQTGAVFWTQGGRAYMLTLTSRPALFPESTFQEVIDSL